LKPINLRYLSGPDVAELALTNDEILMAIEASLRAQGNGGTVIEPRMHLVPDAEFGGHFNVLRGYGGWRKVPGA
jgi:ornithine cyclodeaminase